MQPRRGILRFAGCVVLLAVLDRDQVLRVSEAALGRQVPGDYRLADTNGGTMSLAGLRGAPVVVSFVYTSCYHTCPMVTEYLAEVVAMARKALGGDSFRVLTIGFDTANDNPVRMRQFARERGIDEPYWQFLSGDARTMANLTRDLGFTYVASAKGFDHITQATVLDRDGKVYRQVYGDRFPPPALVEPLKELVFSTPPQAGLIAGLANEVKLFCTVFDPSTGRYRFDYSIFVEIFVAVTCLTGAAVLMFRTWRQTR